MLKALIYEIIGIVQFDHPLNFLLYSCIEYELLCYPLSLSLLSLVRLSGLKYCRSTKALNNKLLRIKQNQDKHLIKSFIDKLDDIGSVIKVNLCYFELRKIIFKVEFLLNIPFKEEFLLKKGEFLLKQKYNSTF